MNFSRQTRWISLVGLILALEPAGAMGQEVGGTVLKRGAFAEDLYVAGGRVDVLASVEGDVIAAGGRVTIGRLIRGDVIAAGGEVTVAGEVLDDVRLVGGLVALDGRIGGDTVAAGGSVRLSPEARVAGRAFLAGADVEVRGAIGRSLRAAGRTIRIDGEVEGDANLVAQDIEILPSARIMGNLTYTSPREARIDPAAQIRGTVTHRPTEIPDQARGAGGRILWAVGVVLLLGLMVAGMVLVLLFPRFTLSAARTVGSDPGKSLAVGFAVLVAAPPAAGLLMVTVVGIPMGLALLALYPVSLLAGLLTGAMFLGDLGTGLGRWQPSKIWRVLLLMAALTLLGLLGAIPIVGVAVLFLALLFGLGALAVHGFRAYGRAFP